MMTALPRVCCAGAARPEPQQVGQREAANTQTTRRQERPARDSITRLARGTREVGKHGKIAASDGYVGLI